MKFYETLILLRTSTAESNLVSLEESFSKIIEEADGQVKTHDRWGRLRLAYPVEHSDYGFYILSRYNLPEQTTTEAMKKIQTMMKIKFNASVIRFVSILISETEYEEIYKKPGAVDFSNFSDDKKNASFRPSTSGVIEENVTSVGPATSEEDEDCQDSDEIETTDIAETKESDLESKTVETEA